MTSLLMGCTSPLFDFYSQEAEIEPFVIDKTRGEVTFVGDLASPWGVNWQKVEEVGLVTGLSGTGSDPALSPQRSRLVQIMKTKDAEDPEGLLARGSNSLVLVSAYLPPGVREGDPIDIEVTTRSRSETTSLRSGHLLPTRLRSVAILGDTFKTGHDAATAEGPVLVDALFEASGDKKLETTGVVLGGGVSLQNRTLGLTIREGSHSIRTATMVGQAVNLRFYLKNSAGSQRGAANPKTNKFIELLIPPEYRHNIGRYLRVVANIPLRETPAHRATRLGLLEKQLLDPLNASAAALRLEAIGAEAEDTLLAGLESEHFECRFYAAESLAYLGRIEAVPVLAKAAKDNPAFRWHALAGLTVMHDVDALEALAELLHVKSAETRYGAFRALYTRNPNDHAIEGRLLDGKFFLHVVPTTSEPLIHFSRSRRPEVVVFGGDARIRPDVHLFAGEKIMITPVTDGTLRVSRFSAGNDFRLECSDRVPEVILAIVKAGGGYGEVLAAMQTAEKEGFIQGRVAVNAVPKPGRKYYAADPDGDERAASSPLPELYQSRENRQEPEVRESRVDRYDWQTEEEADQSYFQSFTGWFRGE